MTDAIWTPARAAQRKMRTDAICIHCGGQDATVMHSWWHCPRLHQGYDPLRQRLLHHMRELGGKPVCLWTLGLVPEGFVPRWPSGAMTSREYRDCPFGTCGKIYTDGAACRTPLGMRAAGGGGGSFTAGTISPIVVRLCEARINRRRERSCELWWRLWKRRKAAAMWLRIANLLCGVIEAWPTVHRYIA